MEGKFDKFFEDNYKQKIVDDLNVESILAKMVREESERKERLIRESISPIHGFIAAKIKWKWVTKLILRSYRIEESQSENKRLFRVYRGKKLLREASFVFAPTITFAHYSGIKQ